MDEEDWEELDEDAMDECMILATQLCTQQPQHQSVPGGHSNTHTAPTSHSSKQHPETTVRKVGGVSNSVRDSGVCSTRGSTLHPSNMTTGTINPKKDVSNSYKSRFSDFSTATTNSYPTTSTRNPIPGLSRRGGLVVSGASSSRSSPTKVKSPTKPWPGSDESATSYASRKKAEEEKAKFQESVLVMQGEISLLRSEMKRKDTVLETERLDHCAAIEAAERRGREKVAKQTVEADAKLKEKVTAYEKLQGELHFKNRELEELLNRCHKLEQQPQTSHTSGPPNKRPRLDKNSLFAKDADLSIPSRFDFSCRPVKASVGVQTEALEQKSVQRRRLDVPSSRGQVCPTRTIATLLSCSATAGSQHTQPASPTPAPQHSSGNTGYSLPSDWFNIISHGLREKDKTVEQKLVGVAVKRLQQTRVGVSQKSGDQCRLPHCPDDPTEWYEGQVGPAIQVLSYFKSFPELCTLQAIIAHLSPLYIKDIVVNRRILCKLLETTERIARLIRQPIERNNNEALVSTLKECCLGIESGSEAQTLLRVAAALSPHFQLCVSSDMCLIGQLCKKVKKLCIPEVDVLRALLDFTWGVVKLASPPLWLNTSCSCCSQLLGTFLWHTYQTLEASHQTDKMRKLHQMLVSCVQLLHYWSTADQDWWEKVSPFPHYPALMAALAFNASSIKFDKETVELLCELYEFEEGTFQR